MKKLFAMCLALVLMLTCFAGCQKDNGSDLDYIKGKGKMVVGVTVYEPMDYQDAQGNWVGFDAEFAQIVGEKLGVDVEFVIIDWGKKFTELKIKEIDAIWNGMTINDDVLANTSCSDPYVKNAQVVVTKADKAANYTTVESLKDLSFAVENESAGAKALDAEGITNYNKMEDQAKALLEVASGTSDACVIDITMARAMTGSGTDFADLAIAMELTTENYGIGFRQGSDLTAKVNDMIKELKADGTLAALAQKYNVTLAD